MERIFLVPGLLGSILSLNGKVVWVKIPFKLADILNPSATPDGILKQYCVKVYQKLDDDLRAIAGAKGATYVEFDYDWRMDIRKTAEALIARIKQEASGSNDTVTLVAHSMGALVCRHMLENKALHGEAWFKKIRNFLSICGPHFGAPLTVARVMGLDSMTIIKKEDVKKMADDHRYPSGYQLLPAPGYTALWDDVGPVNVPENIYLTATQVKYKLDQTNTKVAEQSWGKINLANRPKGVRYVLFAGSSHPTIIGVICSDGQAQLPLKTKKDGDGTVPLWSAAPPGITPTHVFPADHLDILKLPAFRKALYKELGAPIVPKATLTAGTAASATSVNKLVFAPGEQMHVLVVPDSPIGELSGVLKFVSLPPLGADDKGFESAVIGTRSVEYFGPPTDVWSLEMNAPAEPGVYRLDLVGDFGTNEETAAEFIVSEDARPGLQPRAEADPKEGRRNPPKKPRKR